MAMIRAGNTDTHQQSPTPCTRAESGTIPTSIGARSMSKTVSTMLFKYVFSFVINIIRIECVVGRVLKNFIQHSPSLHDNNHVGFAVFNTPGGNPGVVTLGVFHF